jgi:hypothetical protein
MTQLELQKETEPDPYILFEYSIRSPYTKDSYFRRLRRFFDAISLRGATFESRFLSGYLFIWKVSNISPE